MLIIYSNVKCDWKVPSTPVFVFSSLRDSKILTGVTLVGTISEINKTKESRQVREMILDKLPKYIFLNKDEIFLNKDQIFLNRDQILLNKDKIYLNKDQIFLNKNKIFLNRDQIFLVPSDGGTL